MTTLTFTITLTARADDSADEIRKAVITELQNIAERGNVFAFTNNGKEVDITKVFKGDNA